MKKILAFLLLTVLFSSCRVIKYAQFYLSENHQKPKFDEELIQHDPNTVFQFQQGTQKIEEAIGNIEISKTNKKGKDDLANMTLDQYLEEETSTTAFLVIRNDSMLYERYFGGFDAASQLPSFSVAKSFTSALVGIAVEEGFIESIQDPVTKYLEEVRGLAPEWEQLTLEHLLNMRSGIDFNENSYNNPFSTIADLYLKKEVLKIIRKSKFRYPPGERNYYSSLDTQLLGLIVQRTTGKTLAAYLEEKIWKRIGMESDARWFMDSEESGVTKAFCCLHPVARDYAKFGRLYLNNGRWAGAQVVATDWVERSVQPDLTNGCYQYQWYSAKGVDREENEEGELEVKVYADSLAAAQAIERPESQRIARRSSQPDQWYVQNCGAGFYALGIFGQEVQVFPEENLIFVRLGERWDTPTRQLVTKIRSLLEPMN